MKTPSCSSASTASAGKNKICRVKMRDDRGRTSMSFGKISVQILTGSGLGARNGGRHIEMEPL